MERSLPEVHSQAVTRSSPLLVALWHLAWRPVAVFGVLAVAALAWSAKTGGQDAERVGDYFFLELAIGILLSFMFCSAPCLVLIRAAQWRLFMGLVVFMLFLSYIGVVWFISCLVQFWISWGLAGYC